MERENLFLHVVKFFANNYCTGTHIQEMDGTRRPVSNRALLASPRVQDMTVWNGITCFSRALQTSPCVEEKTVWNERTCF